MGGRDSCGMLGEWQIISRVLDGDSMKLSSIYSISKPEERSVLPVGYVQSQQQY